jgi:plasmid stability protein
MQQAQLEQITKLIASMFGRDVKDPEVKMIVGMLQRSEENADKLHQLAMRRGNELDLMKERVRNLIRFDQIDKIKTLVNYES